MASSMPRVNRCDLGQTLFFTSLCAATAISKLKAGDGHYRADVWPITEDIGLYDYAIYIYTHV